MSVLELDTGDRLLLAASLEQGWLELPGGIDGRDLSVQTIEDAAGAPLEFELYGGDRRFLVRNLRQFLPPRLAELWLEYRGQGRFRLGWDAAGADVADEDLSTDHGVHVHLETTHDWSLLYDASHANVTRGQFELALRAAQLSTQAGFDRLISLPLVREMELLDHQVRTTKTVLRRFRGRALLCDEVGLGKTIEAGLILSELHLRGLVRSVLILTPPSLIEQWQGELRRKFSLEFTTHDDPAFRERGAAAWQDCPRVIASIHTAKREPHRSAITARDWDMVIVDEAHHLRNRNTQSWKFASELKKQFILLLTATPVQNNLDELFNLVTLLEPGLLSTARQFQKQFVDRRDKLTPKNVEQLHGLLAEVMVRNRRSTVGLQFTRRWAKTVSLRLSQPERELYRQTTDFVRQHLKQAGQRGGLSRMALISLQMALGSSSQAAAGTLRNMAAAVGRDPHVAAELGRLAEMAAGQSSSAKIDRLLEILREYPDKMVIFTQFRATQALLEERLRAAGHELAVFHGGLSRMEKEAAIARFRGPARLLVATEAGSEGRNLQFAHAVCNFDLPWNPMKIEQRIGRLSRIGQTHDVHVFNLVAAGTIEAAVLHLLDAKLAMFELVIGEIDMILGNLDEEQEFQDLVADLWAESADMDDFARRMEELGNRLLSAKEAYLAQQAHDERLFGNRFSPEA